MVKFTFESTKICDFEFCGVAVKVGKWNMNTSYLKTH